MDAQIEQKIKTRLAELPADIRQAIESAELSQKIRLIGETHHLHIDQIGILSDEIAMIMLGFSDPDDFHRAISTQLEMGPDEVAQIEESVSHDILLPIRESMKLFMEARAAKASEHGPAVAMTPAAAPVPHTAPVPIATPTPAPAPMPNAETILQTPTITAPVPQPVSRPDPYREPIA